MEEPLPRGFPATRHSALVAARSADAAERARGLEVIASVYWRPIYGYLRLRWRRSHDEAKDLAQEFFATLLHGGLLDRFDARRARLRTYLRTCVDGVVASQDRAAARHKRGGGSLTFDFESARAEVEAQTAGSPDAAFERDWARGVFAMALERLRGECEQNGKAQHFALLEQYDLGDQRPTYAALAERHGLTVTDVTNRLHRVRGELRRVTLEILRELTASDDEFRQEARALLGEGGR